MLNKKDLQAIGELLDQKLEEKLEQKLNQKLEEKLGEFLSIINESFTALEKKIDKRPTTEQMFFWADKRFNETESAVESLKYLHIKELKNLPSRNKITKTLAENGLR